MCVYLCRQSPVARDLWGTDSLIATHRIGNIDITCEFLPGLKSDNKGTVRVMHLLIPLLYKSTLFNLTFLTMKIQTFVKEIKEKKMRFQLNNSFILISQLSSKHHQSFIILHTTMKNLLAAESGSGNQKRTSHF